MCRADEKWHVPTQVEYCTSGMQHLKTLKQLPVLLSKSVLFQSRGRLSNKEGINSVMYKHVLGTSNRCFE
jgi:hypothetical protein